MIDIAHGRRAAPVRSQGSGLGLGLRGIARLADRFSIDTDHSGSTISAGFLIENDAPVAKLAEDITDALAKLADADRASVLAEQNKDLLRALSERDLMLKEIHHRTQNNLTLINSLVRLRENAAKQDNVKAALRDVSARIQSIAEVHNQLQRADGLDSLELRPFVHLIVDQMATALSGGKPVRCHVTGANPSVSANQAVDLSLLVGELVTNSLKHAFGAQPDPEIVIEIGTVGDELQMIVRDNGCGLPDGASEASMSSSLGWQVIRSIPPKYDGTIDIVNRGGLRVTVRCQLDRGAYGPVESEKR
jgi:two-component sensor histidine kinase